MLRRGNNITTSQTRNQMIQVTANSGQLEQMLRKLAGDSEYEDKGDEDNVKKEEVTMQESISKSSSSEDCSRRRCCCKMLIRVLDKENKPWIRREIQQGALKYSRAKKRSANPSNRIEMEQLLCLYGLRLVSFWFVVWHDVEDRMDTTAKNICMLDEAVSYGNSPLLGQWTEEI